jgi:hypothetical protein
MCELDNLTNHGDSPRRNPVTDTTDDPGSTQFVAHLSNLGSGSTIDRS